MTERTDTLRTVRRVRDLLQTYRTILNSKAMLHVFQMAQIHGAPYSGEQVNTDEVDEAITEADRILGTTGETVPQTTTAPHTEKP